MLGHSCQIVWMVPFKRDFRKKSNKMTTRFIINVWNLTTKFVYLRLICQQRWLPWALIGWDIFDFSSATPNRIWQNLSRSKYSFVLYQVCVCVMPISQQRLAPRPLICWDFFKLLNRFWQNLTGSKYKTSSINFEVFGRIAKQFRLMDWWCPSVRLSVNILVNLCLSSFSVTLISTDLIPCIGIDLGEISWTTTFPCDPDLHFSCSRSLKNFG